MYRVDRFTGKTVLIVGTEERPVVLEVPEQPTSPEQEAIELVKSGTTLSRRVLEDNEATIRRTLRSKRGTLRVIGWHAKRIDDQIYLVTYSFDDGTGVRAWPFEVNLAADLVRYVIGDSVLERTYGYTEVHKAKVEIDWSFLEASRKP